MRHGLNLDWIDDDEEDGDDEEDIDDSVEQAEQV